MTRNPHSAAAREARPGNLAPLVSRRRAWGRAGLAACSGLLLAACYEPLGCSLLAWVALMPLLAVLLRPSAAAWRLGYLTGFLYFGGSFLWLRVAEPPASWFFPLGLGLLYGGFVAAWAALAKHLYLLLTTSLDDDLEPRHARGRPVAPPPPRQLSPGRELLYTLLLAAAWAALEWVRSWFLSGLPWNLLATAQWRQLWLLPLARFTGVYGISFILASANLGLWLLLRRLHLRRQAARAAADSAATPPAGPPLPWGLAVTAAGLLATLAAARAYPIPTPVDHYRILAVQANLPLMRAYDAADLELAFTTYWTLTRNGAHEHQPDLIMWPETALPVYLLHSPRFAKPFAALVTELETPFIVGALHATDINPDDPDDYIERNSVLCVDSPFALVERYDKIHPVPFGEYVPLGDRYPILTRLFGMGRNLKPGTESTLYAPRPDLRLGFAICFEDCFPGIARDAVRHGATALVTLTNDAWYEQTAGSAQHLAHAVFRSVETLRPMMRNGNNSDTTLILPDGSLVNHLRDPVTHSTFTRQAGLYHLPIYPDLPLTYYTRHGDRFAHLCAGLALLAAAACLRRGLQRRQRLRQHIQPRDDTPDTP